MALKNHVIKWSCHIRVWPLKPQMIAAEKHWQLNHPSPIDTSNLFSIIGLHKPEVGIFYIPTIGPHACRHFYRENSLSPFFCRTNLRIGEAELAAFWKVNIHNKERGTEKKVENEQNAPL